MLGHQQIQNSTETSATRARRKLELKRTFSTLRERILRYHRMRPGSLQPATNYPSPLEPNGGEILEIANKIKATFDGSGSRAREALYLMLRYPAVSIAFDDLEIRVIKSASEMQPPRPHEKHLNAHCRQKGGNFNPFVAQPNLVVDFDPQWGLAELSPPSHRAQTTTR